MTIRTSFHGVEHLQISDIDELDVNGREVPVRHFKVQTANGDSIELVFFGVSREALELERIND